MYSIVLKCRKCKKTIEELIKDNGTITCKHCNQIIRVREY